MENITSENICRIEVTQEFLPAQVLEKKIKTENVSTRTITKLKRDLKGMVKKTKTIIYFKPNKHAKTKKRRCRGRAIISDSD